MGDKEKKEEDPKPEEKKEEKKEEKPEKKEGGGPSDAEKKKEKPKNLTCPRCGTLWDAIRKMWTEPASGKEKEEPPKKAAGFLEGFFSR